MSWPSVAWMVQFEWLLLEIALLVFLGWELYSVRRSIRRDREAAAAARQAEDGVPPPGQAET